MSFGTISTNPNSIFAQRHLNGSSRRFDKSLEKLSSGMRINSAQDDMAGLAVSEKMRFQRNGLHQATRNAQDGYSMLQTAEGVLDTINITLQRGRALAVQSANDTYTTEDRQRIQEEMDLLIHEIDRVSEYSEFNTRKLLDGSGMGKVTTNNLSVITGEVVGEVNLASYSITVNNLGTKHSIQLGTKFERGETLGNKGIEDGAYMEINDRMFELQDEMTVYDLARNINSSKAGVTAKVNDGILSITSNRSGTAHEIRIGPGSGGTNTFLKISPEHGGQVNVLPTDAEISIINVTDMFNPLNLGAFTSQSRTFADQDLSWIEPNGVENQQLKGIRLHITDDLAELGSAKVRVADLRINLQVGPNDEENMKIAVPHINSEILGLSDFYKDQNGIVKEEQVNVSVETQNAAENTIFAFDQALAKVNKLRSYLGGQMSELEKGLIRLGISTENMTASESHIRDVNMASEMTEFTKSQIMIQSSTAMLAQANAKPESVLRVLNP